MSNIIVMAFSPRYIVGCFLKKRITKGGGGHGHPRTPLATPLSSELMSIRLRLAQYGWDKYTVFSNI